LVHECVAGVMATVLTAPLVAWSFGRVALVAIVSNLAAAPLVTLLQPTLFLSVLLSPFPLLSGTVARVAAMPLALLTHVATLFGQLPFAVWRVAPTRVTAVAAALAMMLVVVAIARRRWKPPAAGAAVVALCALWWPVIAPAPKHLEVHMLDVGQGDALALRTPRGQWIIIDAGKVWEGGDDGRRVVIPYLRARGGRVAMFVLSHAHADHVGGAAAIVSALSPQRWVEPAYVFPGRGYLDALEAVHERHVVYRRATPGDRWVIDNVALTVLAPDSGWTAAQHDANETSVVLRVDYGARSFLFTGDAEAGEEAWLLRHAPKGALDVDVLKVGHHGSRTSSTDPFLDAVTPVAALVSVGAGNRYRHPAPETLDRLLARRVPVLRTDADGTVVLGTDGATLWLELGGERHTLVHGGRDLAAPPP
jgi:competence protein ComEC